MWILVLLVFQHVWMIVEGRGGNKGVFTAMCKRWVLRICYELGRTDGIKLIKYYEVNTTTSFTIAYQTRGSGNSAIGKFLLFLMHHDLMRSYLPFPKTFLLLTIFGNHGDRGGTIEFWQITSFRDLSLLRLNYHRERFRKLTFRTLTLTMTPTLTYLPQNLAGNNIILKDFKILPNDLETKHISSTTTYFIQTQQKT